ncbi:MAG: hypothetical protein IT200_17375 [Thermoleophilia bacterium]|nr:hypothetical protein [Thermoleophilia bacterium]
MRLATVLAEVAANLDAAGVTWIVSGSTARRLLGASREPRDLDLEVAVGHAEAAAAALGFALPPAAGGGVSSRRGGGRVGGVEVDVSAGVEVRGPGGVLTRDDAGLRDGVIPVLLGGRTVWCGAPEEGLVRALVSGDWERLAKIASGGGPPPRLDYVARRLAAAIAAR